MLKNLTITLAMLTVTTLTASPALALPSAREGDLVNGTFRLTLNGEVPKDMSFYVEANFGSGTGVICTTDAFMVESGYTECAGNGAVNEMPFVAPASSTIEYRVLGSRGVELSQAVIAEGSEVAVEGLTIDASYALPGDFARYEPVVKGKPTPKDESVGQSKPVTEDTPVAGVQPVVEHVAAEKNAAHNQYKGFGIGSGDDEVLSGLEPSESAASGEAATEVTATVPADSPGAHLRTLPDTSGASTFLLAGGALLALAGGFAFRKMI